jgi:hypothetical protein
MAGLLCQPPAQAFDGAPHLIQRSSLVERRVPNRLQKLRERHGLALTADQVGERLKLHRAQVQSPALPDNLAPCLINAQLFLALLRRTLCPFSTI